VTDAPQLRYIVTNHQNQPVELHLPSGLVVLPPRGRATLTAADLAARQLQVLTASRLVGLHEEAVPAPAAQSDTDSAVADGDDPATEPRGQSGNP
jgi:hypothetical protein